MASECDFVLIGGLAVQIHGGDRFTEDLDLAYRRTRENAKRIASALEGAHPVPREWPESVPFIWDEQTVFSSTILTLVTDLCDTDLLGAPDGAPAYDQLKANSLKIDFDGHELCVASIDDLIAMKRAAGRPKDLADVALLESSRKLGLNPPLK